MKMSRDRFHDNTNSAIAVLLVTAAACAIVVTSLPTDEIGRFVSDNSFKYVHVVTSSSTVAHVSTGVFVNMTRFVPVQVSSRDTFDMKFSFERDFSIFVHDWINDNLTETLNIITITKRKKSLLYIIGHSMSTESLIAEIKSVLSELQKNSLFYICFKDMDNGNKLNWFYALTLRNQEDFSMQELEFEPSSMKISEHYNLEDMTVTSTALDWSPFLEMSSCNDQGEQCQSEGFSYRLALVVAEQSNFTLVSTRDPDGDWGLQPKSGPYNLSGEWGGVMGNVVNGKYQLSLSEWYYIYERDQILDYVVTTADYDLLVLTPQPPEVDTGLFIRPFTKNAWVATIVMSLIILAVLIAPYFFVKQYEQTSAFMVTNISAWYFFVLLNAFYGGALTMFFSSEIRIGFEGIRDVMRAYPEWMLLMMDGNDALFQPKAQQGDPDYKVFWDRVTNLREETVVDSIADGLNRIKGMRAVLHSMSGNLKGYFRNNPFHQQQLFIFGRQKANFNGLIFTKNSPLVPVFDKVIQGLRESGTLEKLLTMWTGQEIKSNVEVEKTVLSSGQVVLVYLIMGMALMMALFILTGEYIIKANANKKEFEHIKKLKSRKMPETKSDNIVYVLPKKGRRTQSWHRGIDQSSKLAEGNGFSKFY